MSTESEQKTDAPPQDPHDPQDPQDPHGPHDPVGGESEELIDPASPESEEPSMESKHGPSTPAPPAREAFTVSSVHHPAAPPQISRSTRIGASLLSLIPGAGHVLLGRIEKGTLYFVLFFATVNSVFLIRVLDDDNKWTAQATWLLFLASGLWFASFIDLIVHLVQWRPQDPQERHARFVAAVGHYLRDELPEARLLLTRLLARNPADSAVSLELANVFGRMGQFKKARRILKKCHRLDRCRVWEYQILSKLRSLEMQRREK